MSELPELEDFRRRVEALRDTPPLSDVLEGDRVELGRLTVDEIHELLPSEASWYLLLAAAGLNRTSLKRATSEPEAAVVSRTKRRAFAVKQRLPITASFSSLVSSAVTMRKADLSRKKRGQVEQHFRDRLRAEGVPVLMSPPVRRVPGLLIPNRKPDGVFPDPAAGHRPQVYLEIKNVRRVSDDIQKRLYELAEVSLEMKLIYGQLSLEGFDRRSTTDVAGDPELRTRLRAMTTASAPAVVGLFICPRAEAERYRDGAEAFIDRIFFQEEVEDCVRYLAELTA